jgi:glycosyltransferase involved in cell wall biosynthesis
MNILSINKADKVGGAAEVACSLNHGLQARGHQVNMFVCDKTTNDPRVFKIPRPKWLFYLSHLLGTDIDLFNTDYILETEEFKQADIIHCHNLHGHYFNLTTLVKMSKLKPVVWTLHDLWASTPYCSHSLSGKISDGFYECPSMASRSWVKQHNQTYLRSKKTKLYSELKVNLVAPSLWLANKIKAGILGQQPLAVIHNGVDLAKFSKQDKIKTRIELNLPQDLKIVLLAASGGKDNIWKGWDYAHQVFAAFTDRPEVLFLCLGGKADRQAPDNVIFVDYIAEQTLLAKYFSASDIFLLTSTAESFALVVIEAMAASLPVVSWPVGVVAEVIEHQVNGYVAQYLNISDLVNGLEYFLKTNQGEQPKILSDNQNKLTGDYSEKTMIDKYEKLFTDLTVK